METDTLLSGFRDFEKKGKKETCPFLDQFLCHIAKTGETMIPWSQFKNYFLFKLEKVMDDFKASSPEQRSSANPNVEYIPYEEMKERILKIVDGYNGIPFTIQRLCELLTEPKRNYTGTDKFLRGIEKNVMVVSCVYPTSEKNGSTCMNRMNGVMFPGNSSAFSDRNVNGPATPRTINRQKFSLSSCVATNGIPDSTEDKDPAVNQPERTVRDSFASEATDSTSDAKKSKHFEDEDADQETRREAKRPKFDQNEEEEEEGEGMKGNGKESSCSALAESSSDVVEPLPHVATELKETAALVPEEEPSSTASESAARVGNSWTEDSPGSSTSPESGSESNHNPAEREKATEELKDPEETQDPVSSSSSAEDGESSAEPTASSTEPAAEGSSSAENTSHSSDTEHVPME